MPVITSYLYSNTFTVQILDYADPTIKTRNRVVYQRPINIYRGADNPITIKFKNQDQKTANIVGSTFQGFITDAIEGNIISNLSVTVSNVTTGTANCTITSNMLTSLPKNRYKLVFKKITSGVQTPVYSDDNYGIHAELIIHRGYET